jgi:hypothetical protein
MQFAFRVQSDTAAKGTVSPEEIDLQQAIHIEAGLDQLIVCEDSNFATVATDSNVATSRSIVLGPTSLSAGYRNGVKLNPDLETLRGLAVSLEPIPIAIPNWIPGATTEFAFSAFGDIGEAGAVQTALISSIRAAGTSTVIAAGNFSASIATGGGSSSGLNADTAAWATEITAQRFLPAIGPDELGASNVLQLLAAKFPYVSEFGGGTPRHYYDRSFGVDTNGVALVHLFVLSAGIASGAVEPSVSAAVLRRDLAQWTWMETRLAAVSSRFRVAVIHHPPSSYGLSGGAEPVQILPEAVELARSGHFDLVVVANSKITEHFVIAGTRVVNCSGCAGGTAPLSDWSGSTALVEQGALLASKAAWLRVVASKDSITWELRERVGGAVVHSETFGPKPPAPLGTMLVSLADYNDGDGPTYLMRMPLTPGGCINLSLPDGMTIVGDNAAILLGAYSGRPAPRGCRLKVLASGF